MLLDTITTPFFFLIDGVQRTAPLAEFCCNEYELFVAVIGPSNVHLHTETV